jgi:hypothetical protein
MIRKSSFSILSKSAGELRSQSTRRRSSRGIAVVCALLLAATPLFPALLAAADLPEWLEAARHTQLGEFGKGAAAVVLEQRIEFTVDSAGKFTRKERGALLIQDRRSAERWMRVGDREDNDQTVVSLLAWSISPAGKIEKTDKKDILTTSAHAGSVLYADSKVKTVAIPNVENGSVVGFEIITSGVSLFPSQKFAMEEEIPVWLSEVHVSVPAGSLTYFTNFPDRIETVVSPGQPRPGAPVKTASFRALKRPGIAPEPSMPPYWTVRASVFVNYDAAGQNAVARWEDAGRAEYPLFAGAQIISPEMAAETDRLVGNIPDELGRVRALFDFASRKIRYVAIFLGDGGFRPHPAPDVFANRYGDCKDKATLLISMLKHAGITAHPALIGTRGSIEAHPEMPNAYSFNHVIVAWPVPEPLRAKVADWPAYDPVSNILWMDPTTDTEPLGHLREDDQGVHALVLTTPESRLLLTPEIPVERNGRRFEARLKLDIFGKGEAEARIEYVGNSNASRAGYYRGRSESDVRRAVEARLARYVTQPALSQVKIDGIEDNYSPVVENIAFKGSFASATTSSGWFFQPLFLSGMDSFEVSSKPRTHTFDWGIAESVSGEYEIELPAGYALDRLPDDVELDTEFGSVKLSFEQEDNILRATHDVRYAGTRIPSEKFEEFRKFYNQISRAERLRLRLRPAP